MTKAERKKRAKEFFTLNVKPGDKFYTIASPHATGKLVAVPRAHGGAHHPLAVQKG